MRIKWLLILILLGITIDYYQTRNQPSTLRVGYCPTMTPYVNQLQKTHTINPRLYSSSQDVLASLTRNEIDLALIGRKAKPDELAANFNLLQIDHQATTLVHNRSDDAAKAYLMLWKDVDYAKVDLVVITTTTGAKDSRYRSPFIYFPQTIKRHLLQQIASTIKGDIL